MAPWVAVLLLVGACVPASGVTTPGATPLCVSSGSGVADYFPTKVTVSDLPSTTTVVKNATTVRLTARDASATLVSVPWRSLTPACWVGAWVKPSR
jgi:hypothetical protein